MIAADPLSIAYKAAWYFYALGPQLVVCLLLGYVSARKSAGSRLNWLVGAFFAAMLPIAGVAVMVALWWFAGRAGRDTASKSDAAPQNVGPPA